MKNNIRIYDNGGKSFDRYTVVYLDFPDGETKTGEKLYLAVGMSVDPFDPQGFAQHCQAILGRHLGERIAFNDLPENCRKLIEQDLGVIQ